GPVDVAAVQAARSLSGRDRDGLGRGRAGGDFRRLRAHGRGALAHDALDHRLLAGLAAVELVGEVTVVLRRAVRDRIAGAIGREALVVVADPLEPIVRRLEELVGDQYDRDPQPGLELWDLVAPLAEEVGRDIDRPRRMDG